jgi:hypothetical protein
VSVLLLATMFFIPMRLVASPVAVEVNDYAQWAGRRADYFNGRLLTSGDLNGEQQYRLGVQRQLGDPGQVLGDPSLTLNDLFAADGRGSVYLSFDCAVIDCHTFSEPTVVANPHRDDMVFLDPAKGTWFGELYLRGIGGLDTGVYRSLSGTFEPVASVSEPGTTALVAAGFVALVAAAGRRRRHGMQAAAAGCAD